MYVHPELIEVTLWILRFINNLKAKTFKITNLNETYLSSDELEYSEKLWIVEIWYFLKQEKNFKLSVKQLNKKLENDIYRCYGRLENTPLLFEHRFPIILLRDHHLAKLINLHFHSFSNQVEVKQTLVEICDIFWITHGRSLVKKILNDSYIYCRYKGQPHPYPEVSPLSKFTLNDSRTFAVVGLIYVVQFCQNCLC